MTPFKPVFYFLWFFLCTSILPSAYSKAPHCWAGCQPWAEHTLLLPWGAESKQICSSEAPLAAPSPVPCLCLNRWRQCMKKDLYIYSHPSCLTLPYFLFWVTQAVSSQMALSYPASSHMVWNPSQLCISPKDNCIALKNVYAACFNKHTPKIPWSKLFLWHTFSCNGWLLS